MSRSQPRGGLDDVSMAIIKQLQEDGRRAYATIGKAVGLSEAAVRQRVQKLVDAGVMQIVAVTDPMQLGFATQAMIAVSVTGDVEKVAAELEGLDEVDYIVVTAGVVRPARRGRRRGRRAPARSRERPHPGDPRHHPHRVLPLPQARQADLQLGRTVTRAPRLEHQ